MPIESSTGAAEDDAVLARSVVRQEIFLDVVAVGLEQHVGAAELTNLLRRPLDHAVAFAALGVFHLAAGGHFEALFGARLGLQLGHLALLMPACRPNPLAGVRPVMLVRALKLLDYSLVRGCRQGRRHCSPY